MTLHRLCRRLGAKLRIRRPLWLLFVGAFLLAWDGLGVLRLGLLCALLHEAGHILVCRRLTGCWPVVTLSPLGLCMSMRGVWLPPEQELWLAAAGPLVNLALCMAAHLFMVWRGASYAGYWFAAANLLVGGFNLLPLPGLDGARILHCLRESQADNQQGKNREGW